jgi:hypothetical protein
MLSLWTKQNYAQARLLDLRDLAFCDHYPRPTAHRGLGLVCVEGRRHLYLGIPELGEFPSRIAVPNERPSVSDDGTTHVVFTLA